MLALAAELKQQNLPPKKAVLTQKKQKDVLLKTLPKKCVPARCALPLFLGAAGVRALPLRAFV